MLVKEVLPFVETNQKKIKVHCAIGRINKFEPLYAFSKGSFKRWQDGQNNKNFGRDFILSLIYYKKGEWLFAGIYRSLDVVQRKSGGYDYITELTNIGEDLIGRLVILFEKEFRASYLNLENHIDDLFVSEITKRPYKLDPFPGFENVNVKYGLLKEIINENEQTWKSALSNVKGVYLISDQLTGKLYV